MISNDNINKNEKSKHRPSYFTPKIKFTPAEDQLLIDAVNQFGCDDWHLICSKVPGRNPRQCRERWNNYVNPRIISSPWTSEEDEKLLKKYEEFGSKWHTIASFFPTRSTNNIKNRFVSLQRKNKKKNKKMLATAKKITNAKKPKVQEKLKENNNQKKDFLNEFQLDDLVLDNTQNNQIQEDPFGFLDILKDSNSLIWSNEYDNIMFS